MPTQLNLTSTPSKSNLPQKHHWVSIIIGISTVLFITIMVLAKLWPCITTTWSQEFCNRWNEFWFSLSASFISAILFYLFFHTLPNKQKRKEMEAHINYELVSVLLHLNTMVVLLTGKIYDYKRLVKELFVEEMVNLNWGKKYSYLMDSSKQKNVIECLKYELNNAQNRLEAIQSKYGDYFTNTEITIFTQDILHSEINQHIVTISETEPINGHRKEAIASMLYDYYFTLLEFSRRFKQSSTYSW